MPGKAQTTGSSLELDTDSSGGLGVTVDQGAAGTDPWLVVEDPPTTIFNGQKLVVTPGTQVAIASSTPVKGVMVKALTTNTGLVYVGNSTVSSADGMPLRAGEFVSMDIANLATVFVDAAVMNEGIAYLGVN